MSGKQNKTSTSGTVEIWRLADENRHVLIRHEDPTDAEVEAEIDGYEAPKRKRRSSKLDPFWKYIIELANRGYGWSEISRFLIESHGLKVDPTSVASWVRANLQVTHRATRAKINALDEIPARGSNDPLSAEMISPISPPGDQETTSEKVAPSNSKNLVNQSKENRVLKYAHLAALTKNR